jgi:NAD+ kinase
MKAGPIRSVGLVVKRGVPEALEVGRRLSAFIKGRGLKVLAEPEAADALDASPLVAPDLARRADLIVVLGGDGTLLGIARLVGAREAPILGINLGGLGFLTQARIVEAQESVARILAGDFSVDRRITLEAVVERRGRQVEPGCEEWLPAVNDVVINKRLLGRIIDLEVFADGMPFCWYRADGLIVSTPTGSTGYALSAGGPIVFPTLDVIVLAPICPHTLTNRPVVLPENLAIEVVVKSPDHEASLTLDGREVATLKEGDLVRVRKGKARVALVSSTHSYFEIWRDKLRWG